ncbi:hypothetical protein AKJ09_02078 [Labilithrix luteola]|uniref:Uncharacterized protein n=1 Tax=Labilithrix luteola TaxID=1391654 RepID=A0A0K1PQM0_9BACT|nr:hypothetical protein [Labilithrix luteola]AKU95414.1 hypothetical protein AKJ09_02078 [Labilithrix luteola]
MAIGVYVQVSRWQVITAMRAAADQLRDERARSDDEPAVEKAFATSCDTMGIPPRDYRETVAADPDLELLEQLAVREALAGSTDPGPYAAISRESMSGQPGNTLKSRTHPETNRRQFDVRAEEEAELDEVVTTEEWLDSRVTSSSIGERWRRRF